MSEQNRNPQMEEVVVEKQNFNLIGSFVTGARKGLDMVFSSMVPNVIFAFAFIQILNLTGLTEIIARVFGPVMGIFGLPGEAATAIIAGFLSTGGGLGATASLATSGALNASHVAILLVGIAMFGSLVQYLGRILGTSGLESRHYGPLIAINIASAALAMFVAQFFV